MAFGDVRVTPAPPRDESAHTDSWEAIGEGTPDASARWRPFRPRRGCERPTWPAAVAQTRDALERGMREWVEVETTNNARAIYWITPKAAHTTIVHRLGRPPFRIIATSLGHDGHGDGHDFMHSKCPCTHQCVGAVKPCSGRNSTAMLEAALARAPLEFTFVRDPVAQLVSAAGQLRSCLTSNRDGRRQFGNRTWLSGEAAEVVELLGYMTQRTAPRVRRFETQDCAAHLFPMASGYSFAGSPGVGRLRFVGRVEQIDADWAHLLALLGMGAAKAPPRRNTNRRTAPLPLRRGGKSYAELAKDESVRAHLKWDQRCFGEVLSLDA